MKNPLISIVFLSSIGLAMACSGGDTGGDEPPQPTATTEFPASITIEGIALNPEGIEYDAKAKAFLLSSLNAGPIAKVNLDGTYELFTSGEEFPLSTAGLQVDAGRNRLLAAGFNGMEIFDDDPATKGASYLRVYNLETGVLEKDVNLSSLLPDAASYFANDLAVDTDGNTYVSDWFAGVIYKVDLAGNASVFWENSSGIPGGPNGLDFHPDGYLLVSVISDGSYTQHALVKVPLDDPSSATNVDVPDTKFHGFDGMVINGKGKVVGVTNNGKTPGGNVFIELSGSNDWQSATVENVKGITASTTVAVTPDNQNYVINQDFSDDALQTWTIERIQF